MDTGGLEIRDHGVYNTNDSTNPHVPYRLYGTANNDLIVGGGKGSKVFLSGAAQLANDPATSGVDESNFARTGAGGSDTIKFSAGENGKGQMDFDIYDFTMGNGAGHDVLDFSSLSASAAHAQTSELEQFRFQGFDYATVDSFVLNSAVVLVNDSPAVDASGVTSVFSFGNNLLNAALGRALNADAVFIVAKTNPNTVGGSVNAVDWGIWHWVDSGVNTPGVETAGYVDVAELSLLSWVHGLDKNQLAAMTANNIVL